MNMDAIVSMAGYHRSTFLKATRLIVLLCGLVFGANQVQASKPWDSWAEDPLFALMKVQSQVMAESNSSYQVSFSQTNLIGYGGGCDNTVTNTNSASVEMPFYKPFQLTVQGSNLYYIQCDLTAMAGVSLMDARRVRDNFPNNIKFLINDVEGGMLSDFNYTNSCGYYSNSWKVEIRWDARPRWRLDDDSNEPDRAPGDGSSLQLGPGMSLSTNRSQIEWNVSLGHLLDNNSAGKLRLLNNGLFASVYTPSNLFYTCKSTNIRSQLELVITNQMSGELRQVKAPQAFVDIVPGTNQYSLKFYHPSQVGSQTNSQGIYTNISGNYFVSWQVVNPDNNPAISNRLHIIENRNGWSRTNILEFNSASSLWTLKEGEGSEQKIETRLVSFASNTSVSPARSNRLETVEIKYYGGQISSQSIEKYELFPWGWNLVETRLDPNGANLSTRMEYYTEGELYEIGRVKYVFNPNGTWEKRIYNGWDSGEPGTLGKVLRPWKDSPLTPQEADESNSHRTEYAAYSEEGVPMYNRQYLYNNDTGYDFWIREETYSENPDYGDTLERFEGKQICEDMTLSVGAYRRFFAPTAPWGLADHPLECSKSGEPVQYYYYDHGSYNPSTRVFSYDPNNHLYTSDASLVINPDRRQTIIYCGLESMDIYGLENDTYRNIGVQLYTMEDHVCDRLLYYYVGQSWKETTVYSQGLPVLREKYACSGTNAWGEPVFELLYQEVLANDTLGHTTNITRMDPVSGLPRTTYSADYRGNNVMDGSLLLSEMDETGKETVYTYDTLKRIKTRTIKGISAMDGYPSQSDQITTYVYDASGRTLSETQSAGSLSMVNASAFDKTGRLTSQTNSDGLVTTFAYPGNTSGTNITLPGGATLLLTNYLDGRLKSKTGTSTIAEYYDYDLDWQYSMGRVQDYTVKRIGALNSGRYVKTGIDWVDNQIYEERPSFSLEGNYTVYKAMPEGYRVTKMTTNDLGRAVTEYDGLERTWRQTLRKYNGLEPNYSFVYTDPVSDDRISQTDTYFKKIANVWYEVTTNLTFLTYNDSTPSVTSVVENQVNNLSSTEISKTSQWDAFNNLTISTVTVDRTKKRTTETLNTAQSVQDATTVKVNDLLQKENTPTVAGYIWHYYDELGREVQTINPQGASSRTFYDAVTGQITNTVDYTGMSTASEYYPATHLNAGQLKCTTAANGKKTFYEYTARGELSRTWGDVPYPEERIYDSYGDMIELHTYRGGSQWANSTWPGTGVACDTNKWLYQAETGYLTNKVDQTGHAVKYAYQNNGLLSTRQWSRGVTTTYLYNEYGDLTAVNYSDGTTPVVYVNEAYTSYNRAGLPAFVSDSTGEHLLFYDILGRPTGDGCTAGTFVNLSITNHYDALYGRDWIKLRVNSTDLLTSTYGYDAYGRLSSASSGVDSAAYAYQNNADLLATTSFKHSGSSKLTTSRTWDYGVRLHSIANNSTGSVSSHVYTYDSVNRRTRATQTDGSAWAYDYNDRNEVVSGKRYWSDFKPVTGQQYEYCYDNIGNLKTNWSGGDASGQNLRPTAFTVNGLNEYTGITIPSYKDVCGVAYANVTITVNGQSTDRKGEYYHSELSVTNVGGALWQTVTVAGATNTTGNLLIAPSSATLVYDNDGNLQQDGLWGYTWDAENRLSKVESISSLPNFAKRKLEFGYDYKGRRIWSKISTNNGSYVLSRNTRFLYDGWNVIGELNATNNALVRSYTWGLDMSHTMDGVGGIGGLVLVADNSSGSTYYPAYDGNGNVMALVNASDASTAAQYEYSPFGELIRATGPMARTNPIRWSTKYWDEESSLVYYGYRYYSPSMERWISRDPSEEQGGNNLYAFCKNNSLNAIDPHGDMLEGLLLAEGDDLGGAVAFAARGYSLLSRIRNAVETYGQIQNMTVQALDAVQNGDGDRLEEMLSAGGTALGSMLLGKTVGVAVGAATSRALGDILSDTTIFKRWIKCSHDPNLPLSASDAKKVWAKLKQMGKTPKYHDKGHSDTKWQGAHINVDGAHIPVDPSFKP